MLTALSATAYTCLTVALFVTEPSNVHLTVQDHVRIDRITDAAVERHGELVPPGTTALQLPMGTYLFRTGSDAEVRLDPAAAVQVVVVPNNKTNDPDLLPAGVPIPAAKGDTPPDWEPTLTVRR